ncbi:CAP-Gly domain-containing linker protein 4 isoform X1 [Gopherus flavomarginatus]|uniref:CAP-Gly domain-containing linker protein 4 isoform X1 n=1 Tax=Gopherus flavomarginatus TaxID=286002 RepID=UPI0021CC20F8|nr:CAP-Gly domain-containing linker protein 4 isoform X1 [Gopherus flavomarginatus]XP_050804489.1 CAP-Gly domain-containing linker protein 4 isoform X1 [Gopherus flavomarginatus]XP_050804490.1 CAP-Gly domain-containing linker protein 4 isoform X1 [Gopherus flavomarginatus]XP_050804491.1 CAP-Gly domain-containing linker protein 4 isoform X1 [Gopherus flavomarginatus]XP_050804492.1 CAP-Gly domain-containing linker protein 4 isoform X1 [Gopherus flavomarginatus]
MTIEDLPEPSQEGDSLIERYQFLFPGPETSVTFSVAAAPMPSDCEFSFFDPNDAACQEILFNPKTSVSELFAILRQWVPQVQQNIDIIGNEIIKRGCSVNDRDGLTDMTLLHYTCKSGAHGIGDVETAAKFASHLIDLGADTSLRSRWTNMNALHYAAYFDVPELIRVILKNAKPKDVDATCSDFDFGTALHIAAFNLCTAAVKCLLEHGANPAFRNDKGQIPADVVPDPVDMPLEMADAAASAKEIKQMLLDAVPLSCDISKAMLPNYDHVTGKAMLLSLGLKLGDRVVIAGQKVGTLRFCGTTEFASGQWAGVELDEPEGKNDGSVGKVQYFKCAPRCGIFAPLSKISKASDHKKNFVRSPSTRSTLVKSKKIDVTHITSKVNTGLATLKKDSSSESTFLASEEGMKIMPGKEGLNNAFPSTRKNPLDEGEIQLGDKVLVVGQRTGTVRFYGTTKFAPGFWCGIELNKPHGKNDGSVGGVQYFSCLPRYGIFAPPSRVQRLTGSLDSLTEVSTGKMNHSFPGFRRSLSTTSASSQKEINRRNSFVKSRSSMLRRSWSNTTTTNTEGPVKLHEGSQVLLTSSNEMGTIRYIGPTDFAPGIWLGLELRSAKGKNDGSVGDKRYFTCKTNHGVLVRPSRVTYRGINGAKLVDDIC